MTRTRWLLRDYRSAGIDELKTVSLEDPSHAFVAGMGMLVLEVRMDGATTRVRFENMFDALNLMGTLTSVL